PRFNTPYMAFVIQGVLATALLLGNALMSSRSDNVFWMVFKLSGVCFLVSYLLVFPAVVVLRHRPPAPPARPAAPIPHAGRDARGVGVLDLLPPVRRVGDRALLHARPDRGGSRGRPAGDLGARRGDGGDARGGARVPAAGAVGGSRALGGPP